MTKAAIDLAPRREPEQERARRTRRRLLDVAAELLVEVGVEGFNTNLLAARAGVRVRSVYRYFPNKLAVIVALAEAMVAEWGAWFDEADRLVDPNSDWRAIWGRLIDAYARGIRAMPGGVAVRRAMHAVPELRAIDQRDNEKLAGQVAAMLARRAGRPSASAGVLSRVLLETAASVIDLSLSLPAGQAAEAVERLKQMHLASLALWFEGEPGGAVASPPEGPGARPRQRADESERKKATSSRRSPSSRSMG
jgi:AcrR family transcriptional regulator